MMTKNTVQPQDIAQEWVLRLYRSVRTWRRVSIKLWLLTGCWIPAGTLCAIAKGREPKLPSHRLALGLPALGHAPICARHGVVHVGRCPRRRDYDDLYAMPVAELRRALQFRKEF